MSSPPPIVLTFAGSDPTGGAGLQADVLTLASMGCHPLSVVTALTVQDTLGVAAFDPVDARRVRMQAERLLEDMPVGGVQDRRARLGGERRGGRRAARRLPRHSAGARSGARLGPRRRARERGDDRRDARAPRAADHGGDAQQPRGAPPRRDDATRLEQAAQRLAAAGASTCSSPARTSPEPRW